MMAHEFALLRRLLKEYSGLHLGEDKEDLLEARLRPVLRELGLSSIAHLALSMMKPDAHLLRERVAQAATVQETYFFRDKAPFHCFIDVMLPRLMVRREMSRHIRVWCAAAATGQEPYSLAIDLAEHERLLAGWTIEIAATDFVEEALERARKGLYSRFEVQRGLPVSLLVKYFSKVERGWEISLDIRSRVAFRAHNLLQNCSALGRFDVIFCRNVLIYFDDATKRGSCRALPRSSRRTAISCSARRRRRRVTAAISWQCRSIIAECSASRLPPPRLLARGRRPSGASELSPALLHVPRTGRS